MVSEKLKEHVIALFLLLVNIGSIQYLFYKIIEYFEFTNIGNLWTSPILTILTALIVLLIQLKLSLVAKKRIQRVLSFSAIIFTVIVGFLIVEIKPVKFFLNYHKASNILNKLFSPNFSLFVPMLGALVQTVYLALMATILAIPFAFVMSFFAARNLMSKKPVPNTIYYIIRTLSTFTRSIEAIVWAIIFTVWVGIGPFAGMLALMIHSIASLIKLYSEQIENIDHGPVEAMLATGANTFQVWVYAVIPQIISPFLAFTIYRWDINIRMATIVGFVGGGGIGQALQQQQQLLKWSNVSIIMLMIAVTVWAMDILSARLREYLLRK